ncbi:hypothetical protein [Photorhabdus khanii]|uniref:Uncharacterized protein n=1 Tax=Photorhabdus khanii subsp. guanajuatensis TaxID=2100166 RepID=A0A4R4J2C8_9GAMM|nr:hypothetical protein [Photorhabdus khanii]TDB47426.1 hypothetical protein C5467_20845 [Photorhabdus khanii subsp. guanajuatensis]
MSEEHKKEIGRSDIEGLTNPWPIRVAITLAAGITYSTLLPVLRQKVVSELYKDDFELKEIKVIGSDIEFKYAKKPKEEGILKGEQEHLRDITKEALDFEKKENLIKSYKIL